MPAYPALWHSIVETKDLHSEEGEQVLALIGKVSNKILMIPWDRVKATCSIELEMIREIAEGLPDARI